MLLAVARCYSQDLNFVHHDNLQPVTVGSENIVVNKLCLSIRAGTEAFIDNVVVEVRLSGSDLSWALLTADNRVQESMLVEIDNNHCATIKLRFRPDRAGNHFTLINTTCPLDGFDCTNGYRVNAQAVEEGAVTPSESTVNTVGHIGLDDIRVVATYFRNNGDELVIDSGNGVTHTIDMCTKGEIIPDSVALLPLPNRQRKAICVTDDNEQFSIGGPDVQLVNGENEIVQRQTFGNLSYSGLYPSSDLRLVGNCNRDVSSTEDVGRLEILINGVWGTVCDDSFGSVDASVACKLLGFNPEGSTDVSNCGGGTGPIHLDSVGCNGDEISLLDCHHDGVNFHDCDHYEDVGVTCNNQVATFASVPCTVSEQNVQWFCGDNVCSFSLPAFRQSASLLNQNTQYRAVDNQEAAAFMGYNLILQANDTYLVLTRLASNNSDIVNEYMTESGAVLVATDAKNTRGYVLKRKSEASHSLTRVSVNELDELLVEENVFNISGLENPVLMATSEKGIISVYDQESNTVNIYQDISANNITLSGCVMPSSPTYGSSELPTSMVEGSGESSSNCDPIMPSPTVVTFIPSPSKCEEGIFTHEVNCWGWQEGTVIAGGTVAILGITVGVAVVAIYAIQSYRNHRIKAGQAMSRNPPPYLQFQPAGLRDQHQVNPNGYQLARDPGTSEMIQLQWNRP